jgi:hypothetical protein
VIQRAAINDLDLLVGLAAEFNAADQHPHDEQPVHRALIPLLADDDAGVPPPERSDGGGDSPPKGGELEGGGEAVGGAAYMRSFMTCVACRASFSKLRDSTSKYAASMPVTASKMRTRSG